MAWSLQAIPDLSDEQFVLWSKLLEERAGIHLGEQQRVFLHTQVTIRMRELGLNDFGDYYVKVRDGVAGLMEWALLIDRLVVNETRFFRDPVSIQFVKQHLEQHLQTSSADAGYDLWSVGCSTGEEPYSLAMVVQELYAKVGLKPRYTITGIDISRAALYVARSGLYTARKVGLIDASLQKRYLVGLTEEQFQVSSLLRDRICFHQGNILNIQEMPQMKVDVIFCQNLLVYFRRWLREEILNAFVTRLKPGGLLVIGLGEVVDWSHPDVQRVSENAVQAYRHN